ncbi:hypothetical protein ElyMa_003125600 [Elysia marginata]|uniref:Uncharacterized protein n=1 Tax=Elysia marginata TaxID=1093978 RepID=A0AAV4ISS7_9GAST|nr:hypothetical protein ElyMa_003125600 [Elysia marginata]
MCARDRRTRTRQGFGLELRFRHELYKRRRARLIIGRAHFESTNYISASNSYKKLFLQKTYQRKMAEAVKFGEIVREYANIKKQSTGRNFNSSNFENVHLHVRYFSAPLTGNSNLLSSSTEQEAAVDNGGARPELKTAKNLENDVTVKILRGYCEDLGQKEVNFELPEGYGKVKIHLKKGEQTVSASKVVVEMASSSGNGAKATVQTQATEKPVSFITKVYPKGKVMFDSGLGSVSTQTILQELLDHESRTVKDIQQDETGFYWIMEGICVMNIGVKHAHKWSS